MAALLTKADPYDKNLSGEEIVHAVGFDGVLPNLPSKDEFDQDFLELSRRCTDHETAARPSFKQIRKELHKQMKLLHKQTLALGSRTNELRLDYELEQIQVI